MKEISVDELKQRVLSSEPTHIIDVREDDEVAMGMIPDAEHIPMNEIPQRVDDFNPNTTYYIVCAGGVRSAKVVTFLNENGIDAVNVEGGMHAWGDEGLEYKRI
ncbi:rhodanese-like domain-containing protein [Staphylococcus lutrae]|uniref:Sulfurtransferase n=1 Tax=Staphylococcus lutrae TaxID=155085 RepID=A0AAC9WIJ4_9STAP|nr:rhodanese-like domain-containing protein [Staphylococcus lutrae]ARJ50043.1 sulfurtransferase [Staphylococcus lutrae]PNZ37074.1 rhodanese-like domain-containing protein [Staphylococcus lutrae]